MTSTTAHITRDRDGASSHTPGPWRSYGPLVYFDMDGPAHHLVADCMQSQNAAMDCANAALIAAAPEMLEALKLAEEDLCIHTKRQWPEWDGVATSESDIGKIRAAIAKAKGREP